VCQIWNLPGLAEPSRLARGGCRGLSTIGLPLRLARTQGRLMTALKPELFGVLASCKATLVSRWATLDLRAPNSAWPIVGAVPHPDPDERMRLRPPVRLQPQRSWAVPGPVGLRGAFHGSAGRGRPPAFPRLAARLLSVPCSAAALVNRFAGGPRSGHHCVWISRERRP